MYQPILNILEQTKSDTLDNYVIAGLSSSLIKNVRYFEMERNQQDFITPHSHRFDFTCLVLEGSVINKIWTLEDSSPKTDLYSVSELTYLDEVGQHKKEYKSSGQYKPMDKIYVKGDTYSMSHKDIHSIEFSKGAKVLFFEGETKSNTSLIIEPIVNGTVINTYEVKPYMFQPRIL